MSRKMCVTMYRSSNGSLKLFVKKIEAEDYVSNCNSRKPSSLSLDRDVVEEVVVWVKILDIGVVNECG